MAKIKKIKLGTTTYDICDADAVHTVKQDGITGATVNRFGTCSTGGSTAAKTVSITTGTFTLETGARVTVKFTNKNTAKNPTLNVNSTGAKNIFHDGAQIKEGVNIDMLCGTVDFVYDGTQWQLVGTDTWRGIQDNLTSTSTTESLSANQGRELKALVDQRLPKLTYEWNKQYTAGGTAGYLLIGSFPMYDSNVTIDIDATTTTTYHGTVIIATQNVSETSIGSAHTINVYGDPTGTISSALRVVWKSGSRNYNVYFVPSTWSKNLIHIRAIGQYLENTDTTKICTQFTTGTAPTTTSGLVINNVLLNTFTAKNTAITGDTRCKITYDSQGLVTGGANLSASDIPNLAASKITSGTFADERIASAATWNAKISSVQATAGANINKVGTPSVTASTTNGVTTLTFNNLKGATGANGSNGTSATWFTGTTVTGTSTSGISATISGSKAGDMYLNTSTANVYRATAANTWRYVCNIKGASGSNGSNGSNGVNGTSAVWFTGTAVTGTSSSKSVTVSGSKAGDMYLNTSTAYVYSATAANTWKYVCCIKGASGSNATVTKAAVEKVLTGTISTHSHTSSSITDTVELAVSSANNTADWDDTCEVGTVAGTKLTFTMPPIPGLVTQTQVSTSTYNKNYPLLLAANDVSVTSGALATTYKNYSKLYANPYSGQLTATSFCATSDKRLKENLETYVPTQSILNLPVYKYNFISDETKTTQIGCLAQDLQTICPEIVSENDEGYLSINESKLTYLLLLEVKRLNAELEALKKETN